MWWCDGSFEYPAPFVPADKWVRNRCGRTLLPSRITRVHDGHTEHRDAGVECQRKPIFADQVKPQRLRVEGLRAFGISRRDERDDWSGFQHALPPGFVTLPGSTDAQKVCVEMYTFCRCAVRLLRANLMELG